MKIGIIGAGAIGGTLARKFRDAGHDVQLANSRGANSVRGRAEEIGVTPVDARGAVRGVAVVVVSIPQGRITELPDRLFEGAPENLVIVDTGNYYPRVRDEEIAAIEAGRPESQWVAEQLGRPVLKAFNSILAGSLVEKGRKAGEIGRIALPVAGDDTDAKRIVIGLVGDAGFDGVDAGSLAESWRQQPGTAAYCTDHPAGELRQALAAADRDSAPDKRDLAIEKMMQLGSGLTNDAWVELNRAIFG
jgi:predicted dinucleotide-binding enzyme